MNASVVLFEDHTWRGLRPVAASQPAFELRCGLFNTRERLELAGAGGHVLCRAWLAPLLNAGPWRVGADALAAAPAEGSRLWLSGRLAPTPTLLTALLTLPPKFPDFTWHDADGLVAARLGPVASAEALAGWTAWRDGRRAQWDGPAPNGGELPLEPFPGQVLRLGAAAPAAVAGALATLLAGACGDAAPALRRIWDVVPATSRAITGDLAAALRAGGWSRRPYGLFPTGESAAPWATAINFERQHQADLPAGAWLLGDDFWCAADVTLAPGVVLDTRKGPVVVDRGCDIAAHTLLEGPLYLGPGTRVKAGARLYGESSFGIGNRLAGEIGESNFGDFTNKQHEGFIGHAVLGAWVNLGAMTTCSDLKNNYGAVRADLGDGPQETGQRFVGLLAGDHVKTAIGTLFNTGTCVGFASNIFGGGMPPKLVPAFSWGGRAEDPVYGLEPAVATAAVVMSRRACRFLPAHRAVFEELARNR